MEPHIEIDPEQVERWLAEFATFGTHGETGVWRTAYTPEWVAAADRYAEWCTDSELAVRRDAVGNVWGRLEGRDGGKAIVSGSHIDTVTPGGRYDGALGAVGALIAVAALGRQFGPPRRPLEAVALCEEESSRFPANFWGSRAIIGGIGPDDPETIIGHDGTSIADAMREIGLDPTRCSEAARNDIGAFVELHIEQGPILEHAGFGVGIVSGITAIRGILVELIGEQNHAGAFPMDLRTDPMAGFAEIASAVIDTADRLGRPAVTTVGRVMVEPNVATVIPRRVRFTIDARHPDPEVCRALCETQDALMRDIAARRKLDILLQVTSEHAACLSNLGILEKLREGAATEGVPVMELSSGAAHDTQQIAKIAPIAMIFVRSENGRSHTQEEFSSLEDMVSGIKVLAAGLHRLAY
jgi:allantoate deiminase